MINRVTSTFFKEGGTLSADAPSYVIRLADSEILDAILSGKYCSVLTPRQMGKSSLMVRTARRLKSHEIRTVVIDLSQIGVEVSSSEWYLGLINWITRDLELSIDEQQWWIEKSQLSPVQRFVEFLHDVVLEVIQESVVIFIDEIDYTLNLPFTDDFFAAIRSLYNARASLPIYNRLSFVLLGVAKPSDLIKDRSRTPYNIGLSIDLTDFTSDEAKTLLPGLQYQFGDQAESILNWVLDWTNGHPYLTQKICAEIVASGKDTVDHDFVDELVYRLFFTDQSRRESNLEPITNSILENPYREKLLRTYNDILLGKSVLDEKRDLVKSQLKLTGIIKATPEGALIVRNSIYLRVFDAEWVRGNLPLLSYRRIIIITAFISVISIFMLAVLLYRRQNREQIMAQSFTQGFHDAESAAVRINNLAGLFRLGNEYTLKGRDLYFNLNLNDQSRIFTDLSNPNQVGQDLILVIRGLYGHLEEENQDAILQSMVINLETMEAAYPDSRILQAEISIWLEGRKQFQLMDYRKAISSFDRALYINDQNWAIYLDRAKAYSRLQDYQHSLEDLARILGSDSTYQPQVIKIVEGNPSLREYMRGREEEFSAILDNIQR